VYCSTHMDENSSVWPPSSLNPPMAPVGPSTGPLPTCRFLPVPLALVGRPCLQPTPGFLQLTRHNFPSLQCLPTSFLIRLGYLFIWSLAGFASFCLPEVFTLAPLPAPTICPWPHPSSKRGSRVPLWEGKERTLKNLSLSVCTGGSPVCGHWRVSADPQV
jgi:hypothetical protein